MQCHREAKEDRGGKGSPDHHGTPQFAGIGDQAEPGDDEKDDDSHEESHPPHAQIVHESFSGAAATAPQCLPGVHRPPTHDCKEQPEESENARPL
jgi:hypothetical protein